MTSSEASRNKIDSLQVRIVPITKAGMAIEYKAGACSLRGIFEAMMTDVMYAVPDNPGIRRVVIRSLFERAGILAVNPEKT